MLSRSYDQSLTNKKLINSTTSTATSIKKVNDDAFATKKLLPSGGLTCSKSNLSRGHKSICTEKEENLLQMLLDCKGFTSDQDRNENVAGVVIWKK